MAATRPVPLLVTWGAALLVSALLVGAGLRWQEPLPLLPWLVWSLILLPPALMGLWLASRWRALASLGASPATGEEGESSESTHTQD